MSRMPVGYYCKKSAKENDKYEGLFSKSQLSDLESETELKVESISKTKLDSLKKNSLGNGRNYSSPYR